MSGGVSRAQRFAQRDPCALAVGALGPGLDYDRVDGKCIHDIHRTSRWPVVLVSVARHGQIAFATERSIEAHVRDVGEGRELGSRLMDPTRDGCWTP